MMDYQDAIKGLKNIKPACGAKNKQYIDAAVSAMKELMEYKELGNLEEVRKGVEKQNPEKPETKVLGEDIEWWCPNCGENHILMDSKKGFDFCHHCGQKLDWGE